MKCRSVDECKTNKHAPWPLIIGLIAHPQPAGVCCIHFDIPCETCYRREDFAHEHGVVFPAPTFPGNIENLKVMEEMNGALH